MKSSVHYFSQKDRIKKGVDPEKLGQRGRQAYEFADLDFPILPGFILDSDVASHLGEYDVVNAIKPSIRRIEEIVDKKYGDSGEDRKSVV